MLLVIRRCRENMTNVTLHILPCNEPYVMLNKSLLMAETLRKRQKSSDLHDTNTTESAD